MADKQTIFFMDDDPELGGFDEPVEPIKEEPEKKEAIEPEVKTEEVKEAPAEEKKEEPAKVEPDRFNETLKMVQSLAEQNKILQEQNKALLEKQTRKEPEPVTPPEKPVFTAAQWEDDYQGCTEAIIEYNDRIKQFQGQQEQARQQEQQTVKQKEIEAAHAESWTLSTDVFPELAEMENGEYKYPELRTAWATVFNSPDAGYKNDPNGPLKATRDLKRFVKERGLNLKPVKEEVKTDEPAPEPKKKDLQAENARLERIVKGTMHGAGQTKGGSGKVKLTQEQLTACERLNCSPEAYIAALSAM